MAQTARLISVAAYAREVQYHIRLLRSPRKDAQAQRLFAAQLQRLDTMTNEILLAQ